MADPAFFRQDKGAITAAQTRLGELETELAEAYARWESLEEFAEC
jgi:ATP-binding cassette subfamily F protein uup